LAFIPVDAPIIHSRVAAQTKNTGIPFDALVAAFSTMVLVKHRIHTLTFATHLRVLALFSTHATVISVS